MTELTFKSTDDELAKALQDAPNLPAEVFAAARLLHAGSTIERYAPHHAIAKLALRFSREFKLARGPVAQLRIAIEFRTAMEEFNAMAVPDRDTFITLDAESTREDGIPGDVRRQDAMRPYPMLSELLDRHLKAFDHGQRMEAERAEREAQAKLAARPAALLTEAETAGASLALESNGKAIRIERADLLQPVMVEEIRSHKSALLAILADRAAAQTLIV